MKESRLDQPHEDMCQECCARCSVNERESTASGARKSKLIRRHCRNLMLKETKLDTASPTGVSRWDSRWEEISGKRDSDIVEESREAPTLERESANSLPGRENDQVSIEDELP